MFEPWCLFFIAPQKSPEHDRISTASSSLWKKHWFWPNPESSKLIPPQGLCWRRSKLRQNSIQDYNNTPKPKLFGKGMIFATIGCMAMTLAKWSLKNRLCRTWLLRIKSASLNDQARVAACTSSRTDSTMLAAASCSGSWEACSQAK